MVTRKIKRILCVGCNDSIYILSYEYFCWWFICVLLFFQILFHLGTFSQITSSTFSWKLCALCMKYVLNKKRFIGLHKMKYGRHSVHQQRFIFRRVLKVLYMTFSTFQIFLDQIEPKVLYFIFYFYH